MLLAACGGARRDTPTRAVTPTRIVSLVPSATEATIALGAMERLVARTDYDVALSNLPSVGGTIDPDLERIVALRPDLVVVWQDSGLPPVHERLTSLGIRTEPMSASSFADIRHIIARLGAILGASARAAQLLRAIDDSLHAVQTSIAHRPRVRAFYMVWPEPLVTAGPGTYVDSLITLAGGVNVFAEASSRWPTVSFEELLRRDPEVIIWPRPAARGVADPIAMLAHRDRWRGLRAIRNGRVVVVDDNLFNRPGPRVALAARALATALHPESREGTPR